MARIPRTDPIEYLVRRKYPAYMAYQTPPPLDGGRSGPSFEARTQYLAEARAYQTQLQDLPFEELEIRYAEEEQKELEELAAKSAAKEERRFLMRHMPMPISHTGQKRPTGPSRRLLRSRSVDHLRSSIGRSWSPIGTYRPSSPNTQKSAILP